MRARAHQQAPTPDDFEMNLKEQVWISSVKREKGNDFVKVLFHFKDDIPEQMLGRKVDVTGEIDLCRARMEAFQKALPEAAEGNFAVGVPKYGDALGVFALPSVLVGRSLHGDQPAALAGGKWSLARTVNAAGFQVVTRPEPACIYWKNPGGVPTIGPWQDGPSVDTFGTFPYKMPPPDPEGGYAIVSVDTPFVGDVALHRGLGKDPGPPKRDIIPAEDVPDHDVLLYTVHLRTFFYLTCPGSEKGSKLFFRVDWGFDVAMLGFGMTEHPEDTQGHMVGSVSVVTPPPDPYPRAASDNGPLSKHWEDRTWADCQPEPK